MHVVSLIGSGDVGNEADLFALANIFLMCGKPLLAAQALLNCVRLTRSLIPYTFRGDDDEYIIRKDGHTLHSSCLMGAAGGVKEITRLVKTIQREAKGEENDILLKVIREVRKEIGKLKKELDDFNLKVLSKEDTYD